MRIELGKRVMSADGKHVGNVDSLIMDEKTRETRGIMLRSGVLLTKDRIIQVERIDRVGDDGTLYLTIPADEVKEQPEFVEREFRVAGADEMPPMPDAWAPTTGHAPIYFGSGFPGVGYEQSGSFFTSAPINPPEVEVESNLPEWDIQLDSGTDVVGSDGDKIGTVDEVEYSEDGSVTGFVVKAGFLFHHDVHIPLDWIEDISSDTVRLHVTADQARETYDTA